MRCLGSLDRTVRFWRPESGECLQVLMEFEAPPFSILALSPTPTSKGDWVTIARGGTVTFWKGKTLRKTIELNVSVVSATEAVGQNILMAGTGWSSRYFTELFLCRLAKALVQS